MRWPCAKVSSAQRLSASKRGRGDHVALDLGVGVVLNAFRHQSEVELRHRLEVTCHVRVLNAFRHQSEVESRRT